MSDHLDAEQIRALVEGRASEGLAHLESGCPECHALFARLYDDDTLARLLEAEAAVPVPVAASSPRPAPSRRAWWAAVPLLAAASALLVLWPRGPDTRAKDSPSAPVVTATFHAGTIEGSGVLLDRELVDGSTIRDTEVLAVRVETDVPAARVAFVVTADGRRVPFWPLSPGEVPVAAARPGEHGAYELAGESGRLTVVAAASPVPTTPQALADAWPGDPSVGWTSITLAVTP